MASGRAFGGVTEAIWNCVKSSSEAQHETKYDPPNANQGTASTKTIVGTIVLGFDFDPAKDTVSYTIEKKPMFVTADQIWSGIQESIDDCDKT